MFDKHTEALGKMPSTEKKKKNISRIWQCLWLGKAPFFTHYHQHGKDNPTSGFLLQKPIKKLDSKIKEIIIITLLKK